jgi:hypothetical protein
MQGPTRTKEIGGRVYTARQPTLSEIINFFDAPPAPLKDFEVVEEMLFPAEEVAMTDLIMMSDAREEDLKGMTEDDLVALARMIKEVNPSFFQMRFRMDRAGQEIARATLPD